MPKCAAQRVEKIRGKWDRYLPCKNQAVAGPYCKEHTPVCAHEGCDSPAYPNQRFIQGGWRRTRDGLVFEGQIQIVCTQDGHVTAIPVPKHLRPKKPKRRSRRGF